MTEHSSTSAEALIRATLRAISEPLALVDRMGRIDFVNDTFHAQFPTHSNDKSLFSLFSLDEPSLPLSVSVHFRAIPYELIISPIAQTSLFVVSVKSLAIDRLLESTLDAALLVTDADF
ncbi:MAG: PAS domain-containing sensor histidine kinase, partial [Exiguobacterium oxidotolerans]